MKALNSFVLLYFSLQTNSPSLTAGTIPLGNGATIYFDPDPKLAGASADIQIYATNSELGLSDDAEIDALLVWDTNQNGKYDGTDQVIFSQAGPVTTAADFNGNGVTNGNDFLIWQHGGSPNSLSQADLKAWQANFGNPSFVTSASIRISTYATNCAKRTPEYDATEPECVPELTGLAKFCHAGITSMWVNKFSPMTIPELLGISIHILNKSKESLPGRRRPRVRPSRFPPNRAA